MKFLLTAVNAKYIHSNPGVYSLRAYAGEELSKHIEIAEYTINHKMEEILWDIYRRQPDVVGFSCYIWNWSLVTELLTELPKLLPGIPIWLGGPEVSFDSLAILEKYPAVTGIMAGEGEATFKELLEYYLQNSEAEDDSAMSHIAGLCLRRGDTCERPLTDLSTIPFLYQTLDDFTKRIIYYESSRGCPYKCSYCLSSIDKRVRLRDINVVKKELKYFLDQKVPQVKFVDRTFNCNHSHTMAVWQYILDNDNGVTNFHFEIAGDILQEEEIALLTKMRPGLVQLEIGVQSVNPHTLKAIHRRMDVQKLSQIVAAVQKGRNVHQHLDLIAGLPYEDYKSFASSFCTVYLMRPDQLQLGFLKVLKGSEMQERAEEFGISYMDRPPYEVLYTKWLSYEELIKLKRIEEMVELYYNSGQFTHTMTYLEGAFENPFSMYEELAAFYERKGFLVHSPARASRYEILLEFAGERDSEDYEVYKELLTYDMYLRENLKSRPQFAADLKDQKDLIRSFYQEEEKTRSYLPGYSSFDHRQLRKMTHLEPFVNPVWDIGWCQKRRTGPNDQKIKDPRPGGFVLYDYRNRSPLNNEAKTIVLTQVDQIWGFSGVMCTREVK